jgi:hypothetical protein
MSQNPLAATVAVNPAGQQAPAKLDAFGNVRIDSAPALTALGITAATVVKPASGRVGTVSVIVPGSTNGGIYDALTTAQAAASNQIAVAPAFATAQIAPLTVNMVTQNGIVAIPGTGQTLAISYE